MSDEAESAEPEWAELAVLLGLRVHPDGPMIGKDHYGVRVRVEIVEGPRTRVTAWLEPALQMGLTLTPRAPDAALEDAVLEDAVLEDAEGPLGFPALERVFETRLADPEHGRRVLGPAVPALLEAARRQPSLRVDDRRVWVELDGAVRAPAALSDALTAVTGVARWLRGTRSQELAAWEQRVGQAWPTLAATWGLHLDAGGLKMSGVVQGRRLAVWIESGPQPRTGLRISVPPLGFVLSVSRADDALLEARFNRGEPIETGDPELDTFRVVGAPEHEVRARLGPTSREALLTLLERASAVSFDDDAVELWSPGAVAHGAGIEAMIADARRAAERLREPPDEGGGGHGPYRS